MKVLILTNPDHKDFVLSAIPPKGTAVYYGQDRYEFHGMEDYDIGISFMYQHKVPAKEVNSHTWFNFHPAPLPEYKGRNLCYHAIMNGETEFGATLHYMDENFDTGEIIRVDWFKILSSDTAEDISEQAINISKSQFKRFLPRILAGEKFLSSPNVGGTYYKKEPINDLYVEGDDFYRFVRAVTYKQFYPKIDIGGVTYKIVRDE